MKVKPFTVYSHLHNAEFTVTHVHDDGGGNPTLTAHSDDIDYMLFSLCEVTCKEPFAYPCHDKHVELNNEQELILVWLTEMLAKSKVTVEMQHRIVEGALPKIKDGHLKGDISEWLADIPLPVYTGGYKRHLDGLTSSIVGTLYGREALSSLYL